MKYAGIALIVLLMLFWMLGIGEVEMLVLVASACALGIVALRRSRRTAS
jgi:hypothetical protein